MADGPTPQATRPGGDLDAFHGALLVTSLLLAAGASLSAHPLGEEPWVTIVRAVG